MHGIHINPSRGLAWDKHVIPGTESFVQLLCSSRLEILITVTHEYISRFRGASLLPSPPLWISSSLFIKNKLRSYLHSPIERCVEERETKTCSSRGCCDWRFRSGCLSQPRLRHQIAADCTKGPIMNHKCFDLDEAAAQIYRREANTSVKCNSGNTFSSLGLSCSNIPI